MTSTNATFADGSCTKALGVGQHQIIGTPSAGAAEYQVGASIASEAVGYGAGVDLFDTPGQQRILGTASFEPLSASTKNPVIALDFQPELTTAVPSKFVRPVIRSPISSRSRSRSTRGSRSTASLSPLSPMVSSTARLTSNLQRRTLPRMVRPSPAPCR